MLGKTCTREIVLYHVVLPFLKGRLTGEWSVQKGKGI